MFELYSEECNIKGEKCLCLTAYKDIFYENYNLSIYKPNKDQWLVCEKYKRYENS